MDLGYSNFKIKSTTDRMTTENWENIFNIFIQSWHNFGKSWRDLKKMWAWQAVYIFHGKFSTL